MYPTQRVYLAGPAAEVERVIGVAIHLESLGFVFTTPWWERVIEEREKGWKTDAEVPEEYMRENCLMNRRGLDLADVVIALTRASGGMSPGTAGEVAYAVALHHTDRIESMRKQVFIVGNPLGFVWSFDPAVTVESTMSDVVGQLSRRA